MHGDDWLLDVGYEIGRASPDDQYEALARRGFRGEGKAAQGDVRGRAHGEVAPHLELCETYAYEPGAPLGCGITAYGGAQDEDVGEADLIAWREQTSAAFRTRVFPGNHFFLHSESAGVLASLVADLEATARGGP